MTTIADAYGAMVDAWVADPTLNRNDSGVIIEGFGSTMSGSSARQWIDAVAVEYSSLGIINNGTFSSLRNSAVADGAVASKNLFDALISRINALAESSPVNDAILLQSNAAEKAKIPGNIVLMESFKNGDPQLDGALDLGIAALHARDAQLP